MRRGRTFYPSNWEGAPDDYYYDTWLVDLTYNTVALLEEGEFCTDLESYEVLLKHFGGHEECFDDADVARLTDLTNEVIQEALDCLEDPTDTEESAA